MKTINLVTISVIGAVFTVLANPFSKALSQENGLSEETQIPLTIDEVVEQSFFQHSLDTFRISTIGGFLNDFLGVTDFLEGSYPENQIRRDAKLFNILHQDLWKQQNESSPMIRTQDLKNPYCTSIQTGLNTICE